MHEQLIEKFAALFAECATTGRADALHKEAAAHSLIKSSDNAVLSALTNPLVLAPLGGAAVGGLTGYYGTKKDKNKKRNAMYGALSGGLGSLGLAVALQNAGPAIKAVTGVDLDTAGAGGDKPPAGGAGAGDGTAKDQTTNASVLAPRIAGGVGGVAGGTGGLALGKTVDGTRLGRGGEVARLTASPRGLIDTVLGRKPAANPYAQSITALRDGYIHGGDRVNQFLDRPQKPQAIAPHPVVSGIPAGTTAFDEAMARHQTTAAAYPGEVTRYQKELAELARKAKIVPQVLGPNGSVGASKADRAAGVKVLAELIRNQAPPGKNPDRGTLHSDLNKVRGFGRTRTAIKGGGGLLGAGAGSLASNYLATAIQNYFAERNNAAPGSGK